MSGDRKGFGGEGMLARFNLYFGRADVVARDETVVGVSTRWFWTKDRWTVDMPNTELELVIDANAEIARVAPPVRLRRDFGPGRWTMRATAGRFIPS